MSELSTAEQWLGCGTTCGGDVGPDVRSVEATLPCVPPPTEDETQLFPAHDEEEEDDEQMIFPAHDELEEDDEEATPIEPLEKGAGKESMARASGGKGKKNSEVPRGADEQGEITKATGGQGKKNSEVPAGGGEKEGQRKKTKSAAADKPEARVGA